MTGTAALLLSTTAGAIMTPSPVTVDERASLLLAAALMQQSDVRHLPVLHGRHVVGVADQTGIVDALRSCSFEAFGQPVSRVMHRDVVRVLPTTALPTVARHLLHSRCGSLVVTDDEGQLLGVVTAVDVLRLLAAGDGR